MKMKKRFLGILLTLVMVMGLVPGMSLTAFAEETAYSYLIPTNADDATALASKVVKFNNIDWYIIADNSTAKKAGTVTLLAKDPIGDARIFDSSTKDYGQSQIKDFLKGLTEETGDFFSVKDCIADTDITDVTTPVIGAKLYLLSKTEAEGLPANVLKSTMANGCASNNNYWWLRTPDDSQYSNSYALRVYGDDGEVRWGNYVYWKFGVRPALKLNLSSVSFSSESKTFTVGSTTVTVTGVSLDKTTALTIDVDGKVSFTATVSPDNATDKTVKWSVGGTDTGAVKLYSDEACTTEVGADATETLTVYAKGISAGSATVTATSNADSTKSATCAVTVTEPGGGVTAPTSKVLSGNGQPQPLVTAGTVSGGTLEYALGTDANTAPTDGWSTEIPTATEAGTYYVWYRIIGDANHNDVAPACVVVTIEAPAAAPAAPESVSDYTLLASMKTSGNKAFKLKWTAVTGAEGYDVFLGDCGGGECTLEKTVTGLSCKIGKLKKGNAYKAFVKAWKTENGQKVYIGEASPDVHAVAGGKSNKYTNAKKISVKKKKLTIAVGGSKKIKASLKKFSNSRRYLNHTAKIRYFSSNRAVATVNAKGKVTGVAPGTCTVYAVAENGLRKGVKITVK